MPGAPTLTTPTGLVPQKSYLVPAIVWFKTLTASAVTESAPKATEFAVLAFAFVPIAIDFSADALANVPIAVAFTAVAFVSVP